MELITTINDTSPRIYSKGIIIPLFTVEFWAVEVSIAFLSYEKEIYLDFVDL